MSSIINKDQSDKKWLAEDYEQHWTAPVTRSEPETQAADSTINYFLILIAILLTVIVTTAYRGL